MKYYIKIRQYKNKITKKRKYRDERDREERTQRKN
jgi:hypothetical protein